tara:strand:+ start:534 stop:833 length:300 start_codon:yes stop_codon:yes gene_type:complete
MTEQEWLNFALAKMHSGQWFGWKTHDDSGNKIPNNQRMTYENIIVHDNSITKPTEAEVNAKIEELKNFQTTFTDKQSSGKQKLKDLGLNDDEIKALMGA